MSLRHALLVLAAFFLAGCQSAPEPMSNRAGEPSTAASPEDSVSIPPPAGGPCVAGESVRIWASPLAPRPGEPIEIVTVATDGALGQLYLTSPDGQTRALRSKAGGGPPWSLRASIYGSNAGSYRIDAMRGGRTVACAEIPVGGGPGDRGSGDWDLPARALYAVWVEHLFDDPPGMAVSFPSLGPVLADRQRNFLHGYLGAREDQGYALEPDCADLSYILRAYFAWKLGLPVSSRACSRGSAGSPPRCNAVVVDSDLAGAQASSVAFRDLSRRIMDRVHSGSGRTALADEATDFYPLPLRREALWPGTLYADPYGHTLVLVKWVPQSRGRPGMLLAVDAQPDNSVNRKRYWEGTFLFANTPSAGPGFKAFRPLAKTGTGTGAGWRPVPNAALQGGLQPYSSEQAGLSPDDFHARMEQLINPNGLDPASAYEDTLAALMEQLESRVRSVARGEEYMRSHGGQKVAMPTGPAIFETTGPWEDYATPSRDMRLLIAMKVLDGLPDRIRRYPPLYRLGGEGPNQAAARIAALHASRAGERSIQYVRTDGSTWRLSLAEIYARLAAMEVAYNPNDCVELRWGAAPNSQEAATCGRRAPQNQQARMEEYRPWFRNTTRPPR